MSVMEKASKPVTSILNIEGKTSKNTIPVVLPRKDQPIYLLGSSSQHGEPSRLLPMKAAAYKQYPNFFNVSCGFFGSIGRDLQRRKPCSIVRVSKLAVDLAKICRNLGIISSYEVGQKLDLLGDHDYVWQDHMEPDHASELTFYKYKYLKLNLRWDLFKPLWEPESVNLALTPLSMPEALPFSVRNISRASQPVLMSSLQLRKEKEAHASGIFFAFNHQMGITTDAELDLVGEHGLIMAHVGLPFSHAMQIQSALKQKHRAERNQPLNERTPLQNFSVVDHVKDALVERMAVISSSQEVERQQKAIKKMLELQRKEEENVVSELDISSELRKELVAWQLKDKLSVYNVQPNPPSPLRGSTVAESRGGRGERGFDGDKLIARGRGREDDGNGLSGQRDREWNRSNDRARGSSFGEGVDKVQEKITGRGGVKSPSRKDSSDGK
ncbi:hypothetical protein CEUSTIGMA_g2314.t1 [Chlamydomonas eustigma]|uniref:Uncharacterized protein n=1 Tax=Chlamydomonas eustigma TaxID=1157962 RepID=A0A250WVL7_9CHLO|nr:hypothetical protein CEUSTIGMA_g2314.t1 [Chlamydomonas eustigma]|eukprot:GAX74868.1 hypothetical protein CEUSTIGMA_g2314.t1 [Chlamydomonas eustigma]